MKITAPRKKKEATPRQTREGTRSSRRKSGKVVNYNEKVLEDAVFEQEPIDLRPWEKKNSSSSSSTSSSSSSSSSSRLGKRKIGRPSKYLDSIDPDSLDSNAWGSNPEEINQFKCGTFDVSLTCIIDCTTSFGTIANEFSSVNFGLTFENQRTAITIFCC